MAARGGKAEPWVRRGYTSFERLSSSGWSQVCFNSFCSVGALRRAPINEF